MTTNLLKKASVVFAAALLLSVNALAEVVLYTDRPTARLLPAAQEFEARTGEKLIILEMPYRKLLERLKVEGENSPADLIFVKDMVYLAELSKGGFFQPMTSPAVTSLVEPQMQDPAKLWNAVTFRARTLVYDPAQVNPDEINTYEDLADAKWAGRLCLRTSNAGYNEALVASFIENMGYDAAKTVVDGLVQNLAMAPARNDNAVIESIALGQCAVGIVNSYYLAGYYATNANFPVKIKFLNQNTTGTHVNGSGIGIAATSKNVALAEKMIGILLEEKFQLQMSSEHLDFPARKGLLPNTFIKDWGTFKVDTANWTTVGARADEARQLFREVNYQ